MNIIYLLFLFVLKSSANKVNRLSVAIDYDCKTIKIAIIRINDAIHIAHDIFGNHEFPAVLYFKGNVVKVGKLALDMLNFDPDNVFMELPCLLVTKETDNDVVQHNQNYPFHKVKYDAKLKKMVIETKNGIIHEIDKLISILINYLVEMSRKEFDNHEMALYDQLKYYNRQITVVAVPYFFKQIERIKLKQIFEMTGFKVELFVERNHAALNSIFMRQYSNILKPNVFNILNFGDSSVEMTFAKVQSYSYSYFGNSFKSYFIDILSANYLKGNSILQIGHEMFTYFKNQIEESNSINIKVNTSRIYGKLIYGVWKLLDQLKYSFDYEYTIKNLDNGFKYTLKINQTHLKEILAPIFVQHEIFIKTSFKNLPGFWIVPKEIFIIGEGANLPFFKENVKQKFKKSKFKRSLDSSNTITYGVAYIAGKNLPGHIHITSNISYNYLSSVKMIISKNNVVEIVIPDIRKEKENHFISYFLHDIIEDFKSEFEYLTLVSPNTNRESNKNSEYVKLNKLVIENLKSQINVNERLNHKNYKGVRITYIMDKFNIIKFQNVESIYIIKRIANLNELKNTSKINSVSKLYIRQYVYEIKKKSLKFKIININDCHVNRKNLKNDTLLLKEEIKSFDEYIRRSIVKNELHLYMKTVEKHFQNKDYILCSTDNEKSKILSFLNDTFSWLKSISKEDIKETDYMDKFDRLINMTEKIDIRVDEKRIRPILIKKMKSLLETTQKFIYNMLMTSSSGKLSKKIFDSNETKALRRLNKNVKIWFNGFISQLHNLSDSQDPAVFNSDLVARIQNLNDQHQLLLTLWTKREDPNDKSTATYDLLIEDISANVTKPINNTNKSLETNVTSNNNITSPYNVTLSILSRNVSDSCVTNETCPNNSIIKETVHSKHPLQ